MQRRPILLHQPIPVWHNVMLHRRNLFFSRKTSAMKFASVEAFLAEVATRNPHQPEFLQAVTEVMESLWPFIEKHPRYAEQSLLERLVEPERVIMFRVSWTDDHGTVQVLSLIHI